MGSGFVAKKSEMPAQMRKSWKCVEVYIERAVITHVITVLATFGVCHKVPKEKFHLRQMKVIDKHSKKAVLKRAYLARFFLISTGRIEANVRGWGKSLIRLIQHIFGWFILQKIVDIRYCDIASTWDYLGLRRRRGNWIPSWAFLRSSSLSI